MQVNHWSGFINLVLLNAEETGFIYTQPNDFIRFTNKFLDLIFINTIAVTVNLHKTAFNRFYQFALPPAACNIAVLAAAYNIAAMGIYTLSEETHSKTSYDSYY